jgi:hypothetical protein
MHSHSWKLSLPGLTYNGRLKKNAAKYKAQTHNYETAAGPKTPASSFHAFASRMVSRQTWGLALRGTCCFSDRDRTHSGVSKYTIPPTQWLMCISSAYITHWYTYGWKVMWILCYAHTLLCHFVIEHGLLQTASSSLRNSRVSPH